MDVFNKVSSQGPLGKYSKYGHGYYFFPELEGEIAPRMMYNGKEKLVWSINDYLGFANHPEVRKVDAEAAAKYGMAYPMGARMMSGETQLHQQFEREAAEFVGKEAAYLVNYGYQAVVSIIQAMVNRKDVIIYDSEAHACIIDGNLLHFGKRFVYPHNNMENFEKELQRATKMVEKTGGGILVISEGVYGMMGDLSRLKEIVAFRKKYNFRIMVDDAHGFGTMGKTGAGTGEHLGVQDEIDIYFTTFAKSMAGVGGFVAGSKDLIRYLMYNMRSQVYAKSLPMPMVAGALKRLDMLKNEPQHKAKLWENVNALQKGLREAGLDLGDTESPVTPVYLKGGMAEATQVTTDLRENYNIFCTVVVYPVVPKDVILIRLIPTARHSLDDVNYTVNAFKEVQIKIQTGAYSKDIRTVPE